MNENPFLTAEEEKKEGQEQETKSNIFAEVSRVEDGGVALKIDGEEGTAKVYTCNKDTRFNIGDKVLVVKESGTYIVVCRVGKKSGLQPKTEDMTQAVGVDADGALWTKPAPNDIKPTSKTTYMTVPVGVDAAGKLWAEKGAEYNKLYTTKTTTSDYVELTTVREFKPAAMSPSQQYSLGTSGAWWGDTYIGGYGEVRICNSSSAAYCALGFFGTAPVARQTVSSTATVAQLITALKKYGLIG